MALSEENGNGLGATMLVGPTATPVYGYPANSCGIGNGDWSWLIVLFLFGMFNGGWGNGGFANNQVGYDFPWLMNGQNGINNNTNAQFAQAATQSAIGDLATAVNTGFGNVATQLCGGFAGVNAGIANGFAQSEISANARQMANMNQMFDMQSAFQNCCCENRFATAQTQNIIQNEAAATRQAILNQLCQDKIDAKNDTIAQLRSELMYARGQASQDVQTATIQSGQRALANEIEQYVAPKSIPAYIVQNPNCCPNTGCGCGCGM